MALLGHEAELHYHSLEPMASQNHQLAIAQELKQKYGEGKITEVCPKCGRRFECYTQGVFQSGRVGGALQVFSDDSVFCNSWLLDEFPAPAYEDVHGSKTKNKQRRMLDGSLFCLFWLRKCRLRVEVLTTVSYHTLVLCLFVLPTIPRNRDQFEGENAGNAAYFLLLANDSFPAIWWWF